MRPLKHRILIVDDEPDVLQTYADMLRSAGFDVHVADNAAAALAMAQALRPSVVLVDQKMPKVEGLELSVALRAEVTPPPRIILFTAFPAVDLGRMEDESPFSRVLFKPVSLRTLVHAIEEELAGIGSA